MQSLQDHGAGGPSHRAAVSSHAISTRRVAWTGVDNAVLEKSAQGRRLARQMERIRKCRQQAGEEIGEDALEVLCVRACIKSHKLWSPSK